MKPRRCTWSGCNAPAVGTYCGHHASRRAASVRLSRQLAKLKPCALPLAVTSRPPWPEQLVDVSLRFCPNAGNFVRYVNARPNPARPERWIEIVDTKRNRVVMRTERTAEQLRPVLRPGERLVLAVRRANGGPNNPRRFWL